jgi:methylthioribose-1-phosphate isomerase
MEAILDLMSRARPTAVNLFWAIERMRRVLASAQEEGASGVEIAARLEDEAARIHDEDLAACRAIGEHGGALVPDGGRVLTHCNAGGLATAGYGTALGVIRGARDAGKTVRVWADETRPFLQGARLTAWELMKDGIETTVLADVAAATLLRRGAIDLVVVGADRIAANGDVANKIGTYPLAVLAREHGVPFYVAAPTSTIDPDCPDGSAIPIEERESREVTELFGTRVAPAGVGVFNPAFDVTPARLVTAIVTERGIARPPFEAALRSLFAR